MPESDTALDRAIESIWASFAEDPTTDEVRSILTTLLAEAERERWRPSMIDIAAERERQTTDEGWTAEHDDQHNRGEIAKAAACYAYGEPIYRVDIRQGTGKDETYILYLPAWPWEDRWWKPKDQRRDLVLAGALILAEIDRLDRKELPHDQ